MNDTQLGLLIVVILGLCQAVKYAGLNTRYVPITAVILGIAGALYFGGVNWLSVLSGLITAFTASGIFSGVKATITS